jgi:3-oxoacyl-[acyl-carrier protein] reductase
MESHMSARKVARVTGSATGVGGAVALLLARRGYNVVINHIRSEVEALATQSQCEAAGVDTLLAQADVADDLACWRMVADVIARWGRLDALVNNAGITSFAGGGDWAALHAEVFRRIYEVNVIGTAR